VNVDAIILANVLEDSSWRSFNSLRKSGRLFLGVCHDENWCQYFADLHSWLDEPNKSFRRAKVLD
jgi:hypothetical protein